MTPTEADRLAIVTAERDRARAIAVSLEQRLARVEAQIVRIDDASRSASRYMDWHRIARKLHALRTALEADA